MRRRRPRRGGGAAVEEAVRSAGVGDKFVLDAGVVQCLVQGFPLLNRDAGVGSAEQAQHRHAMPLAAWSAVPLRSPGCASGRSKTA